MKPLEDIVEETIERFCFEFLDSPYLCYTEHGIHALFYHRFLERMPEERRIIKANGKDICIIQKEYCTWDKLIRTRRANWDIAVLCENQSGNRDKDHYWYDCLELNSVIEFGLNPGESNHVRGDVERLSHEKARVNRKYIVHLYRFSQATTRKDWKTDKPKALVRPDKINDMIKENGNKVIAYWALYNDKTGKGEGPYRIDGKSEPSLLRKDEMYRATS